MVNYDDLPFTPFPDQRQVAERAARHFAHSTKGKIVSAPGTGKTKMAVLATLGILDILLREQNQARLRDRASRFVVGFKVPTLKLGDQLANEIRRDLIPVLPDGLPVKFTFVCSDEGVGATAEGQDVNLRAINDPSVLATNVLDARDGALHIVISTYMSTPVEVAACQGRDPSTCYDLMVLDEAHWSAGMREKTRRAKKRDICFQDAADEKKVPRRFQLALTATEKTVENVRNQKTEVFSMDNPEIYGQNIGGLTVAQAISLGRVRDYRFSPVPVRLSDLKSLVETEGSPYQGMSIEEAATAYTIECMIADPRFEVSQALAFHKGIHAGGGIASSKRMTRALNGRGTLSDGRSIEVLHLDGEASAEESREYFQTLNSPPPAERKILVGSTADAFNEGMNIPHANLVVFDKNRGVQPTNQSIGRVVRTTVDHRRATVAMPIILDDTDPRDAKVDPASLDRLLRVIADIKMIDSRVQERIELYHIPTDREREDGIERPYLLPHPPERAFENKYERLMLDALDYQVGPMMEEVRDRLVAEVLPLAPRNYTCVYWDGDRSQWKVLIPDPRTGKVAVEELFDNADTAAGRYDEYVIENGLNWNLNGILADPRRESQIKRESKVDVGIYERARTGGKRRWVFQKYYTMSEERRQERGEERFRITGQGRDLLEARRIGDAMDARYGQLEARRAPGLEIDFSLLRDKDRTDPEEPSIERCPVRGYWATALDRNGNTLSLGHYASREGALWAAQEGRKLLAEEDASEHTLENALRNSERIETAIREAIPSHLFRVPGALESGGPQDPSRRGMRH